MAIIIPAAVITAPAVCHILNKRKEEQKASNTKSQSWADVLYPNNKEHVNMNIQVTQEVIDTVCNSLRASRQSLHNQLRADDLSQNLTQNKRAIIEHQLAEVEEALRVFQNLES